MSSSQEFTDPIDKTNKAGLSFKFFTENNVLLLVIVLFGRTISNFILL